MNSRRLTRRLPLRALVGTQLLVLVAFTAAWLMLPAFRQREVVAELRQRPVTMDVNISNNAPIRIEPLYDDPEVVTDEELAAVLTKVAPRFGAKHLRPNYIEHALRIWGASIEFRNKGLMSGPQMTEFLTDSASYMESWEGKTQPILESSEDGVFVRWGTDRTTSVHHDHLLACLTEAGVTLDTPVYTARRKMEFRNVLNEALRDFHVDEQETEWSVMAFGFWLAPQKINSWRNGDGREISFDLLAERLMRSNKKYGVCLGTHRVYSLVVLLRLNETYGGQLISPETHSAITKYVEDCRDRIVGAQCADGSWPPNWTDGADAGSRTDPKEKESRRVISTGHHIEWLAIAPQSFHPDRERIHRAADWIIRNTIETPQSVIDENYTFYSHVGNCLALWRKTTPAEFWTSWREKHPDCEDFADAGPEPATKPASSAESGH
jgi:hypothetical protein